MRAVPTGCQIVDACARAHASTDSSELRSTFANGPAWMCGCARNPFQVGAEAKRAAARIAVRRTVMSKDVLRKLGSMRGGAKGEDEVSLTEPSVNG